MDAEMIRMFEADNFKIQHLEPWLGRTRVEVPETSSTLGGLYVADGQSKPLSEQRDQAS